MRQPHHCGAADNDQRTGRGSMRRLAKGVDQDRDRQDTATRPKGAHDDADHQANQQRGQDGVHHACQNPWPVGRQEPALRRAVEFICPL